jgi:acyl carrier protein
MTKEQIRATILKIIAQIVPDEDLSNLKGDIPIREQMKPDSMDFLYVIVELGKRYGVEVPGNDYVQSAISDSSMACLEPMTQGH